MTTATAMEPRSLSNACTAPSRTTLRPGRAIYAFSGSGTTIIVAEMTGRSCFAIEIDPAYVDAIKRWQDFTGQDAPTDRWRRVLL